MYAGRAGGLAKLARSLSWKRQAAGSHISRPGSSSIRSSPRTCRDWLAHNPLLVAQSACLRIDSTSLAGWRKGAVPITAALRSASL